MRITETDACIGAVVEGADLGAPLDEVSFGELEAAFDRRSVLCIRDQTLTPEQFAAFGRRFGPVERIFLAHYAHPDCPDIMLVSNVEEAGRQIGHADAGRVWHTDMSYTARPPRATLLYALEVPEENGRTLGATAFASAVDAYDALDQETKSLIAGRTAVHRVSGRRKTTGTGAQDDGHRARQPDVVHDVARINPATGRTAIYVSEGECVSISGLDDDHALRIVDRLASHIQRPEFAHVHHWRKGDLLMWDNGAVQHRASFDYEWPRHRRLMWRVTVGGAAD